MKFPRKITLLALLLIASLILSAASYEVNDDGSSRYDPRPDLVSAIRDQYWGTCWAQAGIAATESFLILHSMEDSSYQLSVEDALWRSRDEGEGGWVMFDRETSGYPATITGYLTTAGVRLESDIPYLGEPSDGDRMGSNLYGTGENQKPANFDTAPVQYEITDMIYLKNASIPQVKELIQNYGAVGASYMATEEGFNPETSAAWAPDLGGSNHAIAVVGWDDSFPKENFNELDGQAPQNDGAWIVKNSLGTDYGSDGGFIYISYEDGQLFNEGANFSYIYSIAGARKPIGRKCYLHDQFGAIVSIDKAEYGTTVWANVFDFGEEEKIIELSFVSWAEGSAYNMYYAPMDGNVPSADESSWVLLSEGTIDHPGYTTVSSVWEEPVPAGPGAILFSVTGELQSIGTEEPGYADNGRMKYNPVKDAGTAFELKDGAFVPLEVERAIDDHTFMTQPDLSIRAYTVPSPAEPTISPEPTVTEEPTVSPEPTITDVPTVTPEPTVTEVPTVTPEPTITDVPTVTPEPTITDVPTVTPEPTITELPTVTPEPSVTPDLTVTTVPKPSDVPSPSPSGGPTAVPAADTGDHTQPVWYYGILIIAAAAGLGLLIARKRQLNR